MPSEKIWLIMPKPGITLDPIAFTSQADASARYRDQKSGLHSPEQIELHRPPALRPIYGGPTLLEALWGEMDRLMEGLMTKSDAEDGGDKYRAQELAWVLAVVTDPYNPSVDSIRKSAMERWKAAEAEAAAQEEALNPDDQEDMMTRPEGADQ